MLNFRALASSSAGCAYVVTAYGGSRPLLIDAGVPFSAIQRGTNYHASRLAGCLISHGHGDHAKAVKDLIANAIDVYASPETYAYLDVHPTRWTHVLTPRCWRNVGEWDVLAFETVHDIEGSLGFVVQHGNGGKLLYLTDSAYSKYTFDGLTHIAIECNYSRDIMRSNTAGGTIPRERFRRTVQNHMSLDRLIDMLKANDLSRVQEIHLLHLSDQNSDEAEFKDAVERATGVPVYVAPK